MPTTTATPRIVIVGGGAAGIHAARALRGLHELVDVTVVEPTGRHQFLTRLAAVAGGVFEPEAASVALTELLDCEIIEDSVSSIGERSVDLANGPQLDADAVIIAAGADSTVPSIPGIEHALSLRSAADAMRIRDMAASVDAVTIIGGGATGCQLAGALSAGPEPIFVTLIEAGNQLLGGYDRALGLRAFEILTGRGVSVWAGRKVEEILPDGVRTASGLAAGAPICTGGFAAHGSGLISAPTANGRLIVDETGLVSGHSSVFAAGDIAAHPDGDGGVHPMSAQVATRAGKGVAFNALRMLRGMDTEPLELTDLGWVIDLSGGRGVADVFGFPLTMPLVDRVVPILHDVIDSRNLIQIGGLRGLQYVPHTSPATGSRNGPRATVG